MSLPLLQAGAATHRLNRLRGSAAAQPGPVDDRQILCIHRSGAIVAHDQNLVDDISLAFLDIQVDTDLYAVTDGEMDLASSWSCSCRSDGPEGGVDETGSRREEVLQEDGAECDVAVIGNGDGIDRHIIDQTAVFAEIEMRFVICGCPGDRDLSFHYVVARSGFHPGPPAGIGSDRGYCHKPFADPIYRKRRICSPAL